MGSTAEKTDPALWEKVKKKVVREDKGGKPGQWSARKAQLAVHDYKEEGGGYRGKKRADNSLSQWTHEDWGTKSGKESAKTGERYLPRKAREKLSDAEYKRTSDKKRADTAKGRQFSAQPRDVARKVAPTRATGKQATATKRGTAATAKGGAGLAALPRAELLRRAQARNVPGRSRMKKDELVAALSRGGGR